MKKVNNPQTLIKERDMMKKGLLALACLCLLVMVPACKKKEYASSSDNTLSREHMRHNRKTKRVRVVRTEKQANGKTTKKVTRTTKKQYGKTKRANEHVGDKLKAEELNEEDKD